MMSFFRKVKGSVSLILIFVMFPLLTQATMIVDASRINSAKTAVSGAGDLAMNAALSQYDRALQDVYGLFAVSGDDIGSLQDAFEAYFGNTLQGMLTGTDSTTMEYIDQLTSGVVDGIFGNENISDEDMVNHLAMNTIDLTIKANNQSTLGNPAVMKGQIVEYMKYKAPLMFTTSILDQMNALGSSKAQSDAVQAQVEYTETLDSLQSSCDAARKSIDTYNDSVVALNTAAGEPNKVSVMFADGGTVKSELTSATNNMLYYRNIYDKYWTGDNPIYSYSAVESAISSQPAPATYSLAENSSGEYTGKLNDGTPVTYSKTNDDLFYLLNERMRSDNNENSTATSLVKDYKKDVYTGGKYEALFSMEKRVSESAAAIEAELNGINDVNNKLDSLSGQGIDYISSYYSNIVSVYSAETLGSYLHKLEDHNGIIGNYTVTMNMLVNSIVNRADEFLPYVIKQPGTTNTYESESSIAPEDNLKRIRLAEFKADWEILANFTDISAIERAVTSGDYPKISGEETKTYDFNLSKSVITNNYNQRYKSVANKSYTSYNFSGKLSSAITKCESCRDSYLTNANTDLAEAWAPINAYKSKLETVKTNIGDVVSKLGAVKTAAETVQTKHTAWNTKIEATPEGATKNTMESQWEAEGEKIDPQEIAALIAFANAQKSAYEALISKLDAITFFGVKVYSGQMDASTFVNGASAGSWRSTYSSQTALADITDDAAVSAKTSALMGEFYVPSDGGISSDIISKVSIANGSKFTQFGYGASSTNVNAKSHPNQAYFIEMYDNCDEKLALEFYNMLINITREPIGKQEQDNNIQSQLKNKAPKDAKEVKPTETKAKTSVSPDELKSAYSAISGIDLNKLGNDAGGGVNSVSGGMNNMDHVKAKDNQSTSKDLKGKMSSTGSFLDSITKFASQALNETINYAYLEEYFTNMFSCYTTNMDENGNLLEGNDRETTLEGIILCAENNKYFGAEQEYIVWGGTADSAVGMNMATIFAIRFVLNTIYAFTSAEIQSTACSIATAIAGWTVFGVPLVQAIVTMVFALAESGLDLAELSRGESVPIYKTATTWKCSISGITREATEMVIDQAVEKGTEFLTELADDTITDLSESANTYINGQIDSAVSTVKDTLFASTTGAVLEMYGMLGDEVTNSENETKAKIREALERAKSNVGNDTPVQKAANEGMSLIVGSLETEIVDSIYGCLKDTIGKGEDFIYEFQKSVSEKIDSFVDEHLKTTIKGKIDTLSSKLKEAANTNIENASEEVKKQAKDAVKEAFDEYAGDAVDAVQKTDIKDTKTISMNYKQYTKIFMLVGLLTNQDTLLRRCTALIQCNMNHAPNDFKGADYKLSIPNSYTMIEANGEVEINTIFSYSAETTGAAPTTADGGLYSDLAPIWQNSGKSVMKYHSILGY